MQITKNYFRKQIAFKNASIISKNGRLAAGFRTGSIADALSGNVVQPWFWRNSKTMSESISIANKNPNGGKKDENENFYAGIFHYNGSEYTNYIPLNLSSSYNQDNFLNTIAIDYISGQKSPVSIIELDNGNIMFSNSGFYDNGDTLRGGVIEINEI